jgi:hypothetical protein
MPDNWGTQNAMNGILQFYNWMLETSKGGLDTRSLGITVHEYDWSKVNNVIYEKDGDVITIGAGAAGGIPAAAFGLVEKDEGVAFLVVGQRIVVFHPAGKALGFDLSCSDEVAA